MNPISILGGCCAAALALQTTFAADTPEATRSSAERRAPEPPAPIVIDGTGRFAAGYPRVLVRLSINGEPLVGRPVEDMVEQIARANGDWQDLNGAEGVSPLPFFTAVLDTGSPYGAISFDTAARFDLPTAGRTRYAGSGLGSSGFVGSSLVYELSIAATEGRLNQLPVSESGQTAWFLPVSPTARLAAPLDANENVPEVADLFRNTVGMAALRNFLIELDPSDLVRTNDLAPGSLLEGNPAAGPAVQLFGGSANVRYTNAVYRTPLRSAPLANRAHPRNIFPIPDTADLPLLPGLVATRGERSFTGNWVLDTGAPYSVISPRQAVALGLITTEEGAAIANESPMGDWQKRRFRDYSFQTISSLTLPGASSAALQFTNAQVAIADLTFRTDTGEAFEVDGIFGLNLLLPSVSTKDTALTTPAPFPKVWINFPAGELLLGLRDGVSLTGEAEDARAARERRERPPRERASEERTARERRSSTESRPERPPRD